VSQFHQNIIQLGVAYTLLGVFIFTAVATCLSLIGIVKIEKDFQKKLFYGLIFETAIVAVTFFGGVLKFDPQEVYKQAEKDIIKSSQERGVIYIQVPNQTIEKEAGKLQSFLIDKGYVAPEIEVVGSERSPQSSQIRYFYKSQANRARQLLTEMENFGLKNFKVEYVEGLEKESSSDVLEVWYGK
jgi:hypothetical protein